MATHDYIISNASGAAVRADLNNALAAIVSNNSNASSPSTTYAYQWWADTTTGQLKLRNSANSAWITIFELDGTMLMEDGSAASPGLAFASDLNTGFFRSAADKINFATGGVERLEIGSSEVVFNDGSNDVDFRVESNGNAHMLFVDGGNDRIGIGTASPVRDLQLGDNTSASEIISLQTTTSGKGSIYFGDNTATSAEFAGMLRYDHADNSMQFRTSSVEALRIDSSGRLLLGTTTEGAALADNLTVADSGNSGITIRSGAANYGSLYFSDGDAGGAGEYSGFVEYNHNGDYLGFGTGSTTRLTINSSGNVGIGTSSPAGKVHAQVNDSGNSPSLLYLENLGTGNDTGSTIFFRNRVGTAFTDCSIQGLGTGTNQSALVFSTESGSGATERMRLDSSGKLLLNTSTELEASEHAKIQIASTGGGHICLGRNSSSISSGHDLGLIRFYSNDGGSYQEAARIEGEADGDHANNDKAGRIVFGTTASGASFPTERMRITSDGAMKMGDPAQTGNGGLSIFTSDVGSIHQRGRQIMFAKSTCGDVQEIFQVFKGSTGKLLIRADGNLYNAAGGIGVLSDLKLKENIVSANSQWDDIKGIQIRNFNFKEETGHDTHTMLGVVAQEVETVSPGLVSDQPDKDEDGNELGTITKVVNSSVLYMKAVKALQEAMERIETLEQRLFDAGIA